MNAEKLTLQELKMEILIISVIRSGYHMENGLIQHAKNGTTISWKEWGRGGEIFSVVLLSKGRSVL